MTVLPEQAASYGPAQVRDAAVRRTVVLANRHGLHLRTCLAIVQTARQHQAKVTLHKDGQAEDATSVLGLLSLAATPGTTLMLAATGPEAQEAMAAVASLLTRDGEGTDDDDAARRQR
jgi:phosphocarrier protein HPr